MNFDAVRQIEGDLLLSLLIAGFDVASKIQGGIVLQTVFIFEDPPFPDRGCHLELGSAYASASELRWMSDPGFQIHIDRLMAEKAGGKDRKRDKGGFGAVESQLSD